MRKTTPTCGLTALLALLTFSNLTLADSSTSPLQLTPQDALETHGLSIFLFHNSYDPVFGDQKSSGLEIIFHDQRIATNGDVRLSPTPAQWDPIPHFKGRKHGASSNELIPTLAYPDRNLDYRIDVRPEKGGLRVAVILDQPLPSALAGRAGFNLEFLPTAYFGKSYILDDSSGVFPRHPAGPMIAEPKGAPEPTPLATGHAMVLSPEDPLTRVAITSEDAPLKLFDGRNQAPNGWFVVRSLVPSNKTGEVVVWHLYRNLAPGWTRKPVIGYNQVGYTPGRSKIAVLELDPQAQPVPSARVLQVLAEGNSKEVFRGAVLPWGTWLRYQHAHFDFSSVRTPGIYVIEYGDTRTAPFALPQTFTTESGTTPSTPTLPSKWITSKSAKLTASGTALPTSTTHARLHRTTATSTAMPRVPPPTRPLLPASTFPASMSAAGLMPATSISARKLIPASSPISFSRSKTSTSIGTTPASTKTPATSRSASPTAYPTPSNKSFTATFISSLSTKSLATPFPVSSTPLSSNTRIWATPPPTLMAKSTLTKCLLYNPMASTPAFPTIVGPSPPTPRHSTTTPPLLSPPRVVLFAASLTKWPTPACKPPKRSGNKHAQSPALLHSFNTTGGDVHSEEIQLAVELVIATRGKDIYRNRLNQLLPFIQEQFPHEGGTAVRAIPYMNPEFRDALRSMLVAYKPKLDANLAKNPYGVPISMGGWGGSGLVLDFAAQMYFLHQAFPDLVGTDYTFRSLDYILGAHPASNLSYASGIGTQSKLIAYGNNRPDYTFIPGGVIPGVTVIQPDYPELMSDWPFLWYENEYVVDAASAFILVANAANALAKASPAPQ